MRALLLMLAAAAAAFGQLDSGTIAITASQSVPAQSDSATVQVQVTLPDTGVLDDAVALVQPAGFTAADWVSVSSTGYYYVSTGGAPPPANTWNFSKTISVTDVPQTIAALDAKTANGVYYSVNTASPQQPECNYTALISSAQSQAGRIAEAAGRKLGSIVSMLKGAQYQVPTAVVRAGDFSGALLTNERVSSASFLLGQISSTAPTPTCSLTVQFKLM